MDSLPRHKFLHEYAFKEPVDYFSKDGCWLDGFYVSRQSIDKVNDLEIIPYDDAKSRQYCYLDGDCGLTVKEPQLLRPSRSDGYTKMTWEEWQEFVANAHKPKFKPLSEYHEGQEVYIFMEPGVWGGGWVVSRFISWDPARGGRPVLWVLPMDEETEKYCRNLKQSGLLIVNPEYIYPIELFEWRVGYGA